MTSLNISDKNSKIERVLVDLFQLSGYTIKTAVLFSVYLERVPSYHMLILCPNIPRSFIVNIDLNNMNEYINIIVLLQTDLQN